MIWERKEVKCPKCHCKWILREGVYGLCLNCNYKFELGKE